jgi:hypothetical protein
MEEDSLDEYPIGVVVTTAADYICRLDAENYRLVQNRRTFYCFLKNKTNQIVLDLGQQNHNEYLALCARNCSGKLATGQEFFG